MLTDQPRDAGEKVSRLKTLKNNDHKHDKPRFSGFFWNQNTLIVIVIWKLKTILK